jgi:o-succinylbenzoate synthase
MPSSFVRVAWQEYAVPFARDPFVTGRGQVGVREGILVTVEFDDGVRGFGEVAPFNGEGCGLDLAVGALAAGATAVLGRTPGDAWAALRATALPAVVRAGLETALADAAARRAGQPFVVWLAAAYGLPVPALPCRLPVNALVDASTDARIAERAAQAVALGFRAIKVKVGGDPAAAAARVVAAREAVGPGIELRADANGCWDFDGGRRFLVGAREAGLAFCEEPVGDAPPGVLAALAGETGVPLAVDESCRTVEELDRVIAAGAAAAVVVKPAFSGLSEAVAMLRRAQAAGLMAVVTSAIETGTGVAMAAHVAALLPPPAPAAGLATLDLLESGLVEGAPAIAGGELVLTGRAGLGVRPLEDAVRRYATGRGGEVDA